MVFAGFAATAGAVAAWAVTTGLGSVSESRGGEDCFCGSPTLASTSARSGAADAEVAADGGRAGRALACATGAIIAEGIATLGGATVLVNGKLSAPLFYVSPGQINAQLPYETPPGAATLTVNGGTPGSFLVAPNAPGILVYGTNRAIAVNQDYSLNSPDHPALTGGWITVYLSGQGAVNPAVVSGAASPANPVALPVLRQPSAGMPPTLCLPV